MSSPGNPVRFIDLILDCRLLGYGPDQEDPLPGVCLECPTGPLQQAGQRTRGAIHRSYAHPRAESSLRQGRGRVHNHRQRRPADSQRRVPHRVLRRVSTTGSPSRGWTTCREESLRPPHDTTIRCRVVSASVRRPRVLGRRDERRAVLLGESDDLSPTGSSADTHAAPVLTPLLRSPQAGSEPTSARVRTGEPVTTAERRLFQTAILSLRLGQLRNGTTGITENDTRHGTSHNSAKRLQRHDPDDLWRSPRIQPHS